VAHPALEPGIFPARAHTDGAAYETTTPHSDASAAPLSDAPRERDGLSPLRADASNGRLAMSPGSPRDIDPVEFAEHLRRALVDDARRHGIEV
jgi:hypothetical protein